MSIPTDRLVAEALAKSGLLWIRSLAGDAPAWHVAVDGVAYVVGGPGEQELPEHDGICEVVARSKESRARLISFDALAEPMSPEDEDWDRAVAALKAGRLNAPDEDLEARWRESGYVLRIRPDLARVVLRGQVLPAPETAETPDVPGPGSEASNASPPAGATAGEGATAGGARVSR